MHYIYNHMRNKMTNAIQDPEWLHYCHHHVIHILISILSIMAILRWYEQTK